MKRFIAGLSAILAASSIAAAPSPSAPFAAPQIDHELALAIGESGSVTGNAQYGVNVENYTGADYACSSDPNMYCETVLIELTNPYVEEEARKGRVRANLTFTLTPTLPISDYDLLVFEADEDGNLGGQMGNVGETPLTPDPESKETISVPITTTVDEETVWVAVQVVYWAVVGGWTAEATFA